MSQGLFPASRHLTFDMDDSVKAFPLLSHLQRRRKHGHHPSFMPPP
jgi:hypothetical protein